MSVQETNDVIRQALMMSFWLSLPLLATGFVVGIIVSLAQILTSIQDPSVGSFPRLVSFLIALLICLPWMATRLIGYTAALLGDLGRYAR